MGTALNEQVGKSGFGDASGMRLAVVATLDWVDWFNHRRLLEMNVNRPPTEAEAAYHRQMEHTARAA